MSLFDSLVKSVIGRAIGAIFGGPAGWIASAALTFAPDGDGNKFRVDLEKGSWDIVKRPDVTNITEARNAQRLLNRERETRMQAGYVRGMEPINFIVKLPGTGEYVHARKTPEIKPPRGLGKLRTSGSEKQQAKAKAKYVEEYQKLLAHENKMRSRKGLAPAQPGVDFYQLPT